MGASILQPFASPGADTTPAPKTGPRGRPELEQVISLRQVYANVRYDFGELAPSTVISILKDFGRGRLTRPDDLRARVVRDPDIKRAYLTRRQAVASRPWNVTVPEDTPPEQLERVGIKAQLARRALSGLTDLEANQMVALDAIGMGINIQEIGWGTRDGAWMPTKLTPVQTREVWLDADWTPIVRDADWQFHRTAAHPGKFLVHRPVTEAGVLVDNAAFAGAFAIYMAKVYMVRSWLLAAERFGTPLLLGKVLANAPEGTRELLKAALLGLTNDSVAVMPVGSDIEIRAAQGESSGRIYSALSEWASNQIAILFTGRTTLTTPGPNGSRSAEEVADGVRLEGSAQDARMMWGSIKRDVLAWVYYFNGLAGGIDPNVETVFEEEPGSITTDMIDCGVVTENELRKTAGLKATKTGERVAVRKPPAPALAPGAISATGNDPAATADAGAPPKPAAPAAPARNSLLGGLPDLGRVADGVRAALEGHENAIDWKARALAAEAQLATRAP